MLLVDYQTLPRATFRILLDSCEAMHVVAEATDGLAATDAIRSDALLDGIRTVASGEVPCPPRSRAPSSRDHAQFDKSAYTERHAAESWISRPRRHRTAATRYDKLAVGHEATVTITGINEWL